ncbi:phosphoribosyltransferase family protein [Nocardia sp. NPDC004573]
MFFDDRRDAGRRLGSRLEYLRGEDVVVVGLPRGGVPVAYEVARTLDAPLDVIVVRKLGVPYQPELAFGAIGEDDVQVINDVVVGYTRLTREEIATVERRERAELRGRTERLRRTHRRIPLLGRTVVVVDDGIATGATARAACGVAWAHGAQRVVLAVPVAPRDTLSALQEVADEVVCLESPTWFAAVGRWYRSFGQVTDAEVELLLRAAGDGHTLHRTSPDDPPLCDEDIQIRTRETRLSGHLSVPEDPLGMVIFVHGSGSSRHSPRNRLVAEVLNRAGLATLLFDLLTPEEEMDRARVFDIPLLSRRLIDVTRWLLGRADITGMRIGYFGASTGAAAALRAAADPGVPVAAVVSRGGRPDLAGSALSAVRAPTLLIVGGYDCPVLELNRSAAQEMSCETVLTVVPGATHLFIEPGALEKVAELARDWLVAQLAPAPAADSGNGRTHARR